MVCCGVSGVVNCVCVFLLFYFAFYIFLYYICFVFAPLCVLDFCFVKNKHEMSTYLNRGQNFPKMCVHTVSSLKEWDPLITLLNINC